VNTVQSTEDERMDQRKSVERGYKEKTTHDTQIGVPDDTPKWNHDMIGGQIRLKKTIDDPPNKYLNFVVSLFFNQLCLD